MYCKKCKKRKIYIQKWSLCQPCYQTVRKEQLEKDGVFYTKSSPGRNSMSRFKTETDFIKNFFKGNYNWIYHPCTFGLGDTRYEPDFYDGERNVFIEVVGTRQAFYINQEKYVKFKKLFPKIQFEARITTGELIEDIENPHINKLQNDHIEAISK